MCARVTDCPRVRWSLLAFFPQARELTRVQEALSVCLGLLQQSAEAARWRNAALATRRCLPTRHASMTQRGRPGNKEFHHQPTLRELQRRANGDLSAYSQSESTVFRCCRPRPRPRARQTLANAVPDCVAHEHAAVQLTLLNSWRALLGALGDTNGPAVFTSALPVLLCAQEPQPPGSAARGRGGGHILAIAAARTTAAPTTAQWAARFAGSHSIALAVGLARGGR